MAQPVSYNASERFRQCWTLIIDCLAQVRNESDDSCQPLPTYAPQSSLLVGLIAHVHFTLISSPGISRICMIR